MGLFNKNRKDAKWVKPRDPIAAIFPYVMPKKVDAEVSSTIDMDITKLCKWVDKQNKNLDYKMTYFHAFVALFGKTVFNRNRLNRFVKNKRLYERDEIMFSFVAKDKLTDSGKEKMVCIKIKEDDTALTLSKKLAVDIWYSKNHDDNSLDKVINFFTALPKILLSLAVNTIFFLDERGWLPKSFMDTDSNHATILLSNLGSIGTSSCYHHLTNYGTNSIIITIGTIREENGKKIVDITATLDERISDGFYFAKSMQLAQKIANTPELLEEKLSSKFEE